jgi:hypothetical protein
LELNGGVLLLVIGLSADELKLNVVWWFISRKYLGLCGKSGVLTREHRINPEPRYSIAIIRFWLHSSLFAS